MTDLAKLTLAEEVAGLLALRNMCAASLRERGYTIIKNPRRENEARVFVGSAGPDDYTLRIITGSDARSFDGEATAEDVETLAVKASALLAWVPNIAERDRLLGRMAGRAA